MKLLLFGVAVLLHVTNSRACPKECKCFGFNGQWIADCARKGLTSVTYADFDAATTEIHMQYNEIETLDADTFKNVPKLKHLYLQSNKIAVLPDDMFDNLPELESLRLNSNRIGDIGTRQFSSLKKLKLLYIHNNDIKQVERTTFNGLDNVVQISVASNPNLATIDDSAFVGLTNLSMVDLSGTALETLRVAMVTPIRGTLDKIYTYNIDTLICDDDLETYLKWMLANPLTAFGRATMICAKPENLKGRSVAVVDPDRHYTVDGDCPTECSCFYSGSSFIADCSSRGLTSVPVGFGPDTTEIALQNNNIQQLSNNDFLHLTKLEYLFLHDNKIDFWDINAFTGPEKTLKQLTLNNNKLESVPLGVFNGMRSLQILNMNDNGISVLRSEELSDLSSMVQFSINNNSVRIIPDGTFDNLVSLKYIGIAQNLIQSLPEDMLSNSPNLYFCDLSGNTFPELPKIPSSVTQFSARDSGIIALQPSSFSDASNLEVLDLSGNKIYRIDEGTFSPARKLEQLVLSHNHMDKIDADDFASAPNLILLDLSYNDKLTRIDDNAFYAQRRALQRLYLQNGGLRTVSSKPFSIMENSNFYMTLEGNQWNCDCKLEDLSMYVSTHSNKVDDPTCFEPKEEAGKAIVEVSYAENCVNTGVDSDVPEDDAKALVISLSIVGAVVIFAVVVGVIMHNSSKATKKLKAMGESDHYKNGATNQHSNVAYENDSDHEARDAVQL